MCDFENPISKNGHRLLDRRSFLKVAGVSMGAVSSVSYTHLTLPTNREV